MARDRRMPVRTRLLLVMALLALAVLVGVAVGLGRQTRALPPVSAAPPSVPAGLGDAGQSRLGPLDQYMVIGQTPLFYPDRQPKPFVVSNGSASDAPAAATFEFQLTGVVNTPALELAVLQPIQGGEALRVLKGSGPKGAEAWVLQGVEGRTAIFMGPGGEQRLELRRPVDAAMPVPPAGMPAGMPPMPPGVPAPPPPPPPMAAAPTQPPPAAQQAAPPPDSTQPTDAQIEAIRARIQARRAELARERARQGQ